jgi:hypothetical protein
LIGANDHWRVVTGLVGKHTVTGFTLNSGVPNLFGLLAAMMYGSDLITPGC